MHTTLAAVVLASVAAAAPSEEAAGKHMLKKRFLSDNWCGAVQTHSGVKETEATWVVPTISIPSMANASDHFSSYQWVGMGGTSGCTSTGDLLQAGTGMEITNGDFTYYAYYQLFGTTGPLINSDLTVSAGDKVYTKVTVTSSTSGSFYWENHTTGRNDTKTLSSDAGRSICQDSVEWIHERPGDPRRPFPDFTSFSFTGISATDNAGTALNLEGAEDWKMTKDQTNFMLCHPSRNGNTAMEIVQDNEWSD